MSPLSSFKRLSVSSTKSSKSSNCSVPVSVYSHTTPMDISYALNIQSSSQTPSWMYASSNDGGYAEMLDDDNMSWGTGKTSSSNSRSKRSKRLSFKFF